MTPRSGNTPRLLTIAVWIAIVLASSCTSGPPTEERASAANLVVQVRFTTMWWSKAQMEGLNPNNPPPKNTEVELTRWEYTDPIGVPHPDTVDAIVSVDNRGTVSSPDLTATIEGEWNIGPLDDKSAAKWDAPTALAKTDRFQIRGGATHTIRVPVDLKAMMDRLERERRWPHALRITVAVDEVGGKPSVARTQVDFAIRRGD
jgi:hypothetical protein